MDQVAIYAKYIQGFVAGKKFRSPFPWRSDKDPSFSTKWFGDYLCWKDFGDEARSDANKKDVIGFVACYHGENRDEAEERIRSDGFDLIPTTRSFKDRISDIRLPFYFKYSVLRDEHLRYFKMIGVSEDILVKYGIFALDSISKKGREFMKSTSTNLAFYWKFGGAEKGYFPFEQKKKKFWHENVDELEGFEQLDFKRKDLIITKSMKDILVLKSLGYNPISSSGESSLHLIVDRLDDLAGFEDIVVWGDPDSQGEKYAEGIKEIFESVGKTVRRAKSTNGKDPSDILANTQNSKIIHLIIRKSA